MSQSYKKIINQNEKLIFNLQIKEKVVYLQRLHIEKHKCLTL